MKSLSFPSNSFYSSSFPCLALLYPIFSFLSLNLLGFVFFLSLFFPLSLSHYLFLSLLYYVLSYLAIPCLSLRCFTLPSLSLPNITFPSFPFLTFPYLTQHNFPFLTLPIPPHTCHHVTHPPHTTPFPVFPQPA